MVLKVAGNCLLLRPPVSEAVGGQDEGAEGLGVQVVAEKWKLLEEEELQEEEEQEVPQEARRRLGSPGRLECRV